MLYICTHTHTHVYSRIYSETRNLFYEYNFFFLLFNRDSDRYTIITFATVAIVYYFNMKNTIGSSPSCWIYYTLIIICHQERTIFVRSTDYYYYYLVSLRGGGQSVQFYKAFSFSSEYPSESSSAAVCGIGQKNSSFPVVTVRGGIVVFLPDCARYRHPVGRIHGEVGVSFRQTISSTSIRHVPWIVYALINSHRNILETSGRRFAGDRSKTEQIIIPTSRTRTII